MDVNEMRLRFSFGLPSSHDMATVLWLRNAATRCILTCHVVMQLPPRDNCLSFVYVWFLYRGTVLSSEWAAHKPPNGNSNEQTGDNPFFGGVPLMFQTNRSSFPRSIDLNRRMLWVDEYEAKVSGSDCGESYMAHATGCGIPVSNRFMIEHIA